MRRFIDSCVFFPLSLSLSLGVLPFPILTLLLTASVPHPPTPAVPEGLFDDSIDLVVWGHEHDCRIVPEPVAGRPYHVTQPGSSVATSLGEGEGVEK